MTDRIEPTKKNDHAWLQLFKKYDILSSIAKNGLFEVSAKQINEFREARLMTKFDHKVSLPKLFSDNNLSILPITRGSYVISKFEAYKKFENTTQNVLQATIPDYLQSFNHESINNEAIAINCIFISSILSHFLDEDGFLPTVQGRMSSGCFDFTINCVNEKSPKKIFVKNSQIEIDGGFESLSQLALIEAKNYISDDFLIRQLFYPFSLFNNKVSKKITPIFLVYTNSVFSLYEYKFEEPDNYNSIALIKQKNYRIEAGDICLEDIVEIVNKTQPIKEPTDIPFPQADNFKRIINLCELLYHREMKKEEITINYAFDSRQTNYYTDAGRYLNLVTKHKLKNDNITFSLSEKGRFVCGLKYKARQLQFVESILMHGVFSEILKLHLQNSEMPSKEQIISIMKEHDLNAIEADNTYLRRATTVISWINWILDLQR